MGGKDTIIEFIRIKHFKTLREELEYDLQCNENFLVLDSNISKTISSVELFKYASTTTDFG